jgi:hypothetical protein
MVDNWNNAARSALNGIFDEDRTYHRPTLEVLRDDLDKFIEEQFYTGTDKPAVIAWWTIIGADALTIADTELMDITADIVQEVLVRKQRDYGHENIRRFGRQGLMIRIHDKVARLENLLANGETPNNESIEDTLLDIVGYSAIGIMWEKNKFLLPLLPI